MTTIELKYNAFSIKTDLIINGKEAILRCFGTGRDTRLIEWVNDLFPEMMKKCNLGPGAECSVQFYGTQSDFEEVRWAFEKYTGMNSEIKIELPEYKRYPQSLDELKELVSQKINVYTEQISEKKQELEELEADFENKKNNYKPSSSSELVEFEQTLVDCNKAFENIKTTRLTDIEKEINNIKNEMQIFSANKQAVNQNIDITEMDIADLLLSLGKFCNIKHFDNGFDFIVKSLTQKLDSAYGKISMIFDEFILRQIKEYSDYILDLNKKYSDKKYSDIYSEHFKSRLALNVDRSATPWSKEIEVNSLLLWNQIYKIIEIEKDGYPLSGLGISQVLTRYRVIEIEEIKNLCKK
jgi:hypothetical protein